MEVAFVSGDVEDWIQEFARFEDRLTVDVGEFLASDDIVIEVYFSFLESPLVLGRKIEGRDDGSAREGEVESRVAGDFYFPENCLGEGDRVDNVVCFFGSTSFDRVAKGSGGAESWDVDVGEDVIFIFVSIVGDDEV